MKQHGLPEYHSKQIELDQKSQCHSHFSWMVNKSRQCEIRLKHHPNSLCSFFKQKSRYNDKKPRLWWRILIILFYQILQNCQMTTINAKSLHLFVNQKKTVVLALYVASKDRIDDFVNTIVIVQKNADGSFQ